MKKKDENTRVTFIIKELDLIIVGLKDWLRIEREQFRKTEEDWVDKLLNKIEAKYHKNINKESINLILNCDELAKINDAVADNALYNGYLTSESKALAQEITDILWGNYKHRSCYSMSDWENIINNYKKFK